MNPIFNKVILFTDTDGFARFREETVELTKGKPQARLSPLMPSGGMQLRRSPCLLYTSPSPRDYAASRMPSSA